MTINMNCPYCHQYGAHECAKAPYNLYKPVDSSRFYKKDQAPHFLSPGPEFEARKDEVLWTKFMKTSFMVHRGRNTSIDSEVVARLSVLDADAMLTAHNKRWPRE